MYTHSGITLILPNADGTPMRLGDMPDRTQLRQIPVFRGSRTPTSGLDLLATAVGQSGSMALKKTEPSEPVSLSMAGPYNPAAALPPKVVKKVLDLEFVEISELKADIWSDEQDAGLLSRRTPSKPPVTDIKIWLECFARMAALLVTRFPEKGPELWAYQTTILRAAHNWVAYDRQFRREMLAQKDLNWSIPNTRLYNEAFTGRAKTIPRCPHCLGEDHAAGNCPHNPNPLVVGLVSDPRQWAPATVPLQLSQFSMAYQPGGATRVEVCRSFNENKCRFARCRFQHICFECHGHHPATACPCRATPFAGGPMVRNRAAGRGRPGLAHPYLPTRR